MFKYGLPNMQNSTFGQRFKYLREMHNYSCRVLALELGVTQNAVVLWETGNQYPIVKRLIKIADLFGVSLDWLCGRNNV